MSEYSRDKDYGAFKIHHCDAFDWLNHQEINSVHAFVTDPPYGIEFNPKELEKMRSGKGGNWRLPPKLDNSQRKPLPRFTVLTRSNLRSIHLFHELLSVGMIKCLTPGGHVIMASNVLISPIIISEFVKNGFEYRGQIIRDYSTFRGGDRPKFAEEKYKDVAVSLRGRHEPWLIFRKPIESGLLVHENLDKWFTGGFRRIDGAPPQDVIVSTKPLAVERAITPHPTLKPQELMRRLTYIALPLGKGSIVDPFMGSGSTIAAASYNGYNSIGIEIDKDFYMQAELTISLLRQL